MVKRKSGKFVAGTKKIANSGRRKGTKNRATVERETAFGLLADDLFSDPDYWERAKERIMRGRAPHLEKFIWEKRFGKEPLPIHVAEPIQIEVNWERDWRDVEAEGLERAAPVM